MRNDIKSKLAVIKCFSVMEMKRAFYHVVLNNESADLCTFITPFLMIFQIILN